LKEENQKEFNVFRKNFQAGVHSMSIKEGVFKQDLAFTFAFWGVPTTCRAITSFDMKMKKSSMKITGETTTECTNCTEGECYLLSPDEKDINFEIPFTLDENKILIDMSDDAAMCESSSGDHPLVLEYVRKGLL